MRPLLLFVFLAATPTLPRNSAAPVVASRVVSVTTIACAFPSGRDENAVAFDARYCSKVSEHVATEANASEERVRRVEKLTIEDVALKLEALLGAEEGDDVD